MDANLRQRPVGDLFTDVSALLAPRTVAVIGASDEPGNVGGAAVRFFGKFRSPCTVWPVSRGRTSVGGLACHPSVADLPGRADLAILAVPARAVATVVRDCAAVGIRAGIAWAGGFAEGGEPGAALQAALAATCHDTGFALLGPNCIGIIDTHAPMPASFASMMLSFDRLLPGNISMVSQSGGLATMALALAQRQGCGFRYMVSTGNEAVVGVADFIHAFAADTATKVIAVYLEGVRDGAQFRRALLQARAAGKPAVVIKAGATMASAAAAAAHTGALAGEGRVWDAVLRDCAAIQVRSLEELLDVALQLSADLGRLPQGRGVAAVTFGGGSGVLSADQCDRVGLTMPALSASTRDALAGLVPPIASTRNPVDLTPMAYLDPTWLPRFPKSLDTIAADPGIGTVFFQLGPMASGDAAMAQAVVDFRARCPKPVVAAWPLAIDAAQERAQAGSLYLLSEYGRAVGVIARLAEYAEALVPAAAAAVADFDWAAAVPAPAAGTVIAEHACHAILASAGLAVARGRLATTEAEAIAIAAEIGGPVAMKGISPAVTHRAAAGLLALGIVSTEAVRETWRMLCGRAAALGVALDGVYVQQIVNAGVELLVSAFRDPQFGVMLSLGAGGTMTELIDDVTLVCAPVDADTARRALRRLRSVQKRGEGMDIGPLAAFVARFSAVAAAAPWSRFVLEVNPVAWNGAAVVALDGLLIIEQP
ncbi:MAG: acetate--CoA ligase family protein [Acidisphaera sp.]|nr:acetate--CoA ligase family protein [Acidisphaera sp.]